MFHLQIISSGWFSRIYSVIRHVLCPLTHSRFISVEDLLYHNKALVIDSNKQITSQQTPIVPSSYPSGSETFNILFCGEMWENLLENGTTMKGSNSRVYLQKIVPHSQQRFFRQKNHRHVKVNQ